jgi:hypothetical protein
LGALSGDGRRFVSGHQNGEVLVWEAPDWKVMATLSLPGKRPVGQVAIAPTAHRSSPRVRRSRSSGPWPARRRRRSPASARGTTSATGSPSVRRATSWRPAGCLRSYCTT